MNELPDFTAVSQQASALALASTPAELHGGLCGWLAAGGVDRHDWLAAVLADPGLTAPETGSALDRLRAVSVAQLEDRDFAFELLLSPASASVIERTGALFDWCRGFLGGFGLASGSRPALSDEGEEALEDLARLAASSSDDFEVGDEDEDSLAEIEEFVRVAVLLLHGDCVLAARHRKSLN
ncbi:MAG: YecA family protein [Stenotrophomonas sp.]